MAISLDQNILNILKEKYKDGVESLLKADSSALREVKVVRVSGEATNMAAVSDCGGAVSSNALVAKDKAAAMPPTAEFRVTPGELYSVFTFGYREVQSSDKGGAYERITGIKSFCAATAMRKVLGKAFYGRGYGEIAVLGTANAALLAAASAGDEITLELPISAVMGLARDMDLVVKTSVSDATEQVILTITKINGKKVTVQVGTGAYAAAAATNVLAYRGSIDENGGPGLPVGLAGWLPIIGARQEGTGGVASAWDTYISTPFYGRNRSVNVDGEAGGFYYDTNNTTYKADLQGAIMWSRIMGGKCDFIVLHPLALQILDNETTSANTYFTATSTTAKKSARLGFEKFAASFSTNSIDTIFDDAFINEKEFYVLTKDLVELWAYTNAERAKEDSISGNNPGKQDPMEFNDKGHENDPYKLLIDDILTVESGDYTRHAGSVRCTYNLCGTFAVINPSVMVHGLFHDAVPADIVSCVA